MAVKTKKRVSRKKAKEGISSEQGEQYSEYVQKRAYYIWQEAGQPLGMDMDIWLKAERDVKAWLMEQ